jgi:hypothetical protein|tara:strand:- start:64 stop:591 length:528 start_codon:yes stop_codon:yes gene_type:complete
MILLSNHLLTLSEFRNVDNVVVRINMAHVRDSKELKNFLDRDYDVFLDYPKGRTKPPVPTLSFIEAINATKKYSNIKYFATSNIEEVAEVNLICELLPEGVSFVPKIETLKGVLNLNKLFDTDKIKHIMLDTEDLYTDVKNDVELFLNLKDRVKKSCENYNVELLELYGVIFNGK